MTELDERVSGLDIFGFSVDSGTSSTALVGVQCRRDAIESSKYFWRLFVLSWLGAPKQIASGAPSVKSWAVGRSSLTRA